VGRVYSFVTSIGAHGALNAVDVLDRRTDIVQQASDNAAVSGVLRNLIRPRSAYLKWLVNVSATHRLLRFGVFELNLDTVELRKSGTAVRLPPQSFKLLALLASHAAQIVSREEIQKELWGDETFVDFEHGVNKCIKQIRSALGDNAEHPLYIETLPRHGYRFVAPVVSKTIPAPRPRVVESTSSEWNSLSLLTNARAAASAAGAVAQRSPATVVEPEPEVAPLGQVRSGVWRVRLLWGGLAVVLAALISGALYWRARKAHTLTEKDTIVIAEFDNKTGDKAFDDTNLGPALSYQLEQSGFLKVLSDDRIAQTFTLMAKPADARLTHGLVREVCVRTGSAATIEGSISSLGSQYLIGLKAVNCQNGDVMAEAEVTANDKEHVIKALGDAATKLRKRLGDSLSSGKYDVPLESVTTTSLAALRAYTLGYQGQNGKADYTAAAQFFQQAITLDPNFAMAYARLGVTYYNLGQTDRAMENLSKAYELRDRASEREKLYISTHYQDTVTGDLEAARQAYESWARLYPRDEIPLSNLGNIYLNFGEFESALATFLKLRELSPESGLSYGGLVSTYAFLNRPEEARAIAKEAQAHGSDSPENHMSLYSIYFQQQNKEGMEQEAAMLLGKPGDQDAMLYLLSDTAAYDGRLTKARELTRRATDSARRADAKETAAAYEAGAAVREALVGNMGLARQQAQAALALSTGRDVEAVSAVALALAGDSAQATRRAADLSERFPHDTIVQFTYLPSIRAAAALQSGSPAKALETLAPAAPYELGVISGSVDFALYPVYLRGEAYLAAHQGAAAAAEFQKILDHPGVVGNELIGALAHLGLGRAYALSGDTTKARAAYQDFFTLWKNADPEIPILKPAKTEYSKLL